MRLLLLLAVLACFAVLPAATAQESSPSHRRAAEDLLRAMDMETIMAGSMDLMLALELERNPELAPFEDVMRAFFTRYMGWDGLLPRLAGLYAETFTETELREMTAFYSTPTGRRAAALTPGLMDDAAQLGREIVIEHQGELAALIEARVRRLQGDK